MLKTEFRYGQSFFKTTSSFGNAKARLMPWVAGAMVFALAPLAHAQSGSTVTLESANKSVSITGELVEFDDDSFTIRGALGLIAVPRSGVVCTGDGCPVVAPEVVEEIVSGEVVLASVNDETRIAGELIGVEDGHYVIRNALGGFRIPISSVSCLGEACPVIEQPKPSITILTATPKLNAALADMLRAYAQINGQQVEISGTEAGAQAVQVYANGGQDLVAEINLEVRTPADAAQAFSEGAADLLIYEQAQMAGLASSEATGGVAISPLAFDGEVVVSHGDNPVRRLSSAEIEKIWSGEITSWQPFAGGNAPIALHMVADSGEAKGWLTGLRASTTPGVITHSSEQEVIAAVEADRNALGIVHWGAAQKARAKMLELSKSCGLTSKPSAFGLRTLHYPFTEAVNSYGSGVGMPAFAKSFLDWTQTASAAPSVSNHGYLAAETQRTKLEDMGIALIHTAADEPDFDGVEFASMMRELRSADRLSMTFTFISGSTILDPASVANAKRLAKSLRSNEFSDKELLLVGFADNTGPASDNTALSVRRAATVRSALDAELDEATRARLEVIEMGFGEQMPSDCNTTEIGRENNRRVEVWLRLKS